MGMAGPLISMGTQAASMAAGAGAAAAPAAAAGASSPFLTIGQNSPMPAAGTTGLLDIAGAANVQPNIDTGTLTGSDLGIRGADSFDAQPIVQEEFQYTDHKGNEKSYTASPRSGGLRDNAVRMGGTPTGAPDPVADAAKAQAQSRMLAQEKGIASTIPDRNPTRLATSNLDMPTRSPARVGGPTPDYFSGVQPAGPIANAMPTPSLAGQTSSPINNVNQLPTDSGARSFAASTSAQDLTQGLPQSLAGRGPSPTSPFPELSAGRVAQTNIPVNPVNTAANVNVTDVPKTNQFTSTANNTTTIPKTNLYASQEFIDNVMTQQANNLEMQQNQQVSQSPLRADTPNSQISQPQSPVQGLLTTTSQTPTDDSSSLFGGINDRISTASKSPLFQGGLGLLAAGYDGSNPYTALQKGIGISNALNKGGDENKQQALLAAQLAALTNKNKSPVYNPGLLTSSRPSGARVIR